MSAAFKGLCEIGQIGCTVTDIEASIKFYRDKMGLRFLFQAPGMAFFDCSGVRLMLALPEGKEKHGYNSILYFKVPDIHAAITALERNGIVFEQKARMIARMPDHELWLAAFRDPDNNPIEVMSEVRKQ